MTYFSKLNAVPTEMLSARLIAEYETDSSYAVRWFRTEHGHAVQYAAHLRRFSGEIADIYAAEVYAYYVRHAAECSGLLDSL